MNGKSIVNMNTKLDKSATSRPTVLTVVWDGATDEQVQSAALGQIKVDVANKFRSDEAIPATYTYLVRDRGVRGMQAPVTLETETARAETLADDDRRKLAERILASLKPAVGTVQPKQKVA